MNKPADNLIRSLETGQPVEWDPVLLTVIQMPIWTDQRAFTALQIIADELTDLVREVARNYHDELAIGCIVKRMLRDAMRQAERAQ